MDVPNDPCLWEVRMLIDSSTELEYFHHD